MFIAQFVFNLLAFLAFLAATIIYALPMVGNKMSAWVLTVLAIVFLLVAILVTFALPSGTLLQPFPFQPLNPHSRPSRRQEQPPALPLPP